MVGCGLLENPNWLGTNECEYADEPIQQIKQILGIQQRIEEEKMMSKADELFDEIFEKLGYKKHELKDVNNSVIFIVYEKKYIQNNRNMSRTINFNILDECLHIKNIQILDSQELQAINEKVKELGWLDK